MLSAYLAERWFAYITTCSVSVLLAVVRLVTAARSSAVACERLANSTEISVMLLADPAWYPPFQEICCRSRRSACALMKCAWNDVQVFFCSDLVAPGIAVFLKFSRLRDEAVGDADNFSLYDGLARRGCIVNVLVKPHVEAFK